MRSPTGCELFTGIFDKATKSLGTVRLMSKVAFSAGSSQQGKHRRASVDSNCVTAAYVSSPFSLIYLLLQKTYF